MEYTDGVETKTLQRHMRDQKTMMQHCFVTDVRDLSIDEAILVSKSKNVPLPSIKGVRQRQASPHGNIYTAATATIRVRNQTRTEQVMTKIQQERTVLLYCRRRQDSGLELPHQLVSLLRQTESQDSMGQDSR